MSTYTEYPITEPTPVVMTRLGKHGAWEPIASKLVGAGYHLQAAGSVASHHVARTPVCYVRIARHAPRGTWRVLHGSWRWFTDADGRKALRNTFDREGESFRLARTQHREEIKGRAVVSLFGAVVAGIGGVAGWHHVPEMLQGPALNALMATTPLGLGLIGRPEGASLNVLDKAKGPKGRFYSDDVIRAVLELNITRITRAVRDGAEVRARGGFDPQTKAHNFVVTLVGGATAENVIALQNELCASLGVHRSQVIVRQGETSNQVIIEISSEPVTKRKPVAASTLKAKEVDISEPIILGTDAMGQPVGVELDQALIIIGTSGSGKTVTVQNLAANVVLDPTADLWLWDGKGDGDYAHLAHAAKVEIIGDGAEDPTMVTRGLAMLKELSKEASRRGEWLLANGKSKVTPEMGRTIPGLQPIICIVDECQFLMDNKEARELVTELVRRIRSKNIRIVVASQAVKRGTAVDHTFPGLFRKKIALQLSDGAEVTTLLGNTAMAEGFDATSNSMQIGEAIIAAKGEGLRRLQVFNLSEDQLESIGRRREPVTKLDVTAGFSTSDEEPKPKFSQVATSSPVDTGMDTTPDTDHRSRNLIADMWQTRINDEPGVNVETFCARLAAFDGAWKDIDSDRLRTLMKDGYGIKTRPISGGVRGYHYDLDIKPLLNKGDN